MEAKAIGDTHSEVKTKALLDTLAYMLAQVNAEALVETVIITLA